MLNPQKIEKLCLDIIDQLRQSYQEKDLIATGETVNSIHFELDVKTGSFVILGAEWIEQTETGVPPGATDSSPATLTKLNAWAEVRRVNIPALELAELLNEKGSRLWQGTDPRFQGRSSHVLSDVINEGLITEIEEKYSELALQGYYSDLKNLFSQTINI